MKYLPNALSLSRLPIAAALALAAVYGYWLAALVLLVVGCATDVADGEVARRTGHGSKFGAEVLEPYCDLALNVGAIAGLLFTARLDYRLVIAAAVVYAVGMYCANFTAGLTRRIAWTFLPFYYLAVLTALVLAYAFLALTGPAFVAFTVVTVVSLASLAVVKRRRIMQWIRP